MADDSMSRAEVAEGVEPSAQAPEALYVILQDWFIAAQDHSKDWRKQAWEDFEFYAGRQWSEADKAELERQKRVALTFDLTSSIIDAITGIEETSRTEIQYLPRSTEPGEVLANEVLSAASEWMADEADAEYEQSHAFSDTCCCGMGWTETRVVYDRDADGGYSEERVDPREMYWDPAATRKNLQDARYLFRARQVPRAKAQRMFPDAEPRDLHAAFVEDTLDRTTLRAEVSPRRHSVADARFPSHSIDDERDMVTLVHAQWIEYETAFRIADPVTQSELRLSEDQFDEYDAMMKNAGVEFKFVKQPRAVYRQAWLGARMLSEPEELPAGDLFSWQCITGKLDRNRGTFFGLITKMRDPQMWTNKLASTALDLVNKTSKGGILAETDAFADIQQAERTYNRPDAITFTSPGAIAKGKIMAKPGAALTNGYIAFMETAKQGVRESVGINNELLGMRDVNQPGVLEAHRKKSSMTMQSGLFDAFAHFKKQVGRIRLAFAQRYFSDGRLVRITDLAGAMQAVQLTKDATAGRYDVIVGDAPTSPNQRQETWMQIGVMIPALQPFMKPELAAKLIEYAPLPQQLIAEMRQIITGDGDERQQQMQEMAAKLGLQKELAAIESERAAAMEDKASALALQAKAGRDRAAAVLDMARASAEHSREQLERVRLELDAQRGAALTPASPGAVSIDAPLVQQTGVGPAPTPQLPELGEGVMREPAAPGALDMVRALLRRGGE